MMNFIKSKSSIKITVFLLIYWVFVVSGSSLSIPIQVIPDETTQLLNIYAMIQNLSLKLPYETAYTFWVHLTYIPFTLIYWGIEYIFLGLPSIESFKLHVAANYMNVLPFLRGASTAFLLFTTFLVSKVLVNKFNTRVSIFFIIFFLTDLLLFINLHYSKHWIVDISWIFLSIFLYDKYLNQNSRYYFYFAVISFFMGVFSSQALIVSIFYHFFLFMDSNRSKKSFIYDSIAICIIGLIFLWLTLILGPGKILGEIFFESTTTQLNANLLIVPDFLKSLFDYNPLLSIATLISAGIALYKKDFKLILLILPLISYLLLISTFHYEPRYGLFLVVTMSVISSIAIIRIKSNYYLYSIIGVFIAINLTLLISWHIIAVSKDTREMASDWALENISNKSFIIYNTLSFNYIPLSKEGISFVNNNFPMAIGTREKLHISLDLPDGKNGIILRKIEEGGYKGSSIISELIKNGYEPILINERFGENAYFHQPAIVTYENILENCSYSIVTEFLPYGEKPLNYNEYGDILYNFTGVLKSLSLFERPGPIITIFSFDSIQPNTCY